MHIDHLVLTVRDLDATIRFYRDLLGMRAATFGEGRTALHFGNQKINLHQVGREFEPKALHPTPGSADLCFLLEPPLEEIAAKLRARGVEILLGPVERQGAEGPMESIYLRDPDGNLIELSNRPKGRSATFSTHVGRRSMATAERGETIAMVRGLSTSLAALVGDLTDAQLDTLVGEGEWTVRQVVHHLADAHFVLFARMKWILTEEDPMLKPYQQEEWAALPDAARAPLETSLSILRGLQERCAVLLESVPESNWSRAGMHPEAGQVTLRDLLAKIAEHGQIHLRQIARLRAAQGL